MDMVRGSSYPMIALVVLSRTALILLGVRMFESIPEIEITIIIAFMVTLGWLSCVQWSRFVAHNKKHDNDTDTHFAIFPYLVIPVVGSAVAIFASLFVGDYAIIHGYVSGVEEITFVISVLSVAIYMVLDYYVISHLGDATYYTTIESKVSKSTVDSVDSDQALELLRKILNK